MRTGIFYFTSTGNSLHIAREIGKAYKESELISIPQVLKDKDYFHEYDIVGFVFPIYYGSMPELVDRFIRAVDVPRAKYIFAVASKGSKMKFNVMTHIDRLLQEHDQELSYGKEIMMVENYIRKFPVDKFGNPMLLLKDAEPVIGKAINDIATMENNRPFKTTVIGTIAEYLYNSWVKKLGTIDKKFVVEPGCIQCRICVDVCPTNNIEIEDGEPAWSGNCQDCLGCIHSCPSKVIQIGKKTQGMKRYIHPEIQLKDIMDSAP